MKKVKLIFGLGITVLLLSTLFLMLTQKGWAPNGNFLERMMSRNSSDSIIVNIQPLDGITDVNAAANQLDVFLKDLAPKPFKIKILPHRESPDSMYNNNHTRFRARKLMQFLHETTTKGEFTIGVTDRDISTAVHGQDDYGVLGLSSLGSKRACIVSTFRLKYRKDLWKLMAHEFIHGFFHQHHCSADDDACIMQDAKGKNPKFENKIYICPICVCSICNEYN